MTKLIINREKEYYIPILDIAILVLLVFISMSAGTMWGYSYRYPACRLLLVVALLRIVLRKEMTISGWKVYFLLIMGFLFYNWSVSYNPSNTLKYLFVYLGIGSVALNNIEDKFWGTFFRAIEVLALIVSFSVLISVISPQLFAQLSSFIVGKAKIGSILSKAAKGQFSGIAAEIAEAAVIANYGLAFSLSNIFTGKKVKNNVIFGIIHLLALILTTKRTLSVIAILVTFMFLVICEKDVRKKVRYFAVAAVLALVGVVVISFVPSLQTLFERFSGDDYENMNGREVLWMYSEKMFSEKPVLGYGYGSYNAYANANGLRYFGGKWSANGHNSYLQLLGETGIIGTVLLLFPLMYTLLRNLVYVMWGTITEENKRKLLLCIYIQIMYTVYSITGNTLTNTQQIYMWFLVFFYSNSIFYNMKKEEE